MLYLLSYFSDFFGPLRLFEYVTFRAGGAAITAFLLVLLLGKYVAKALRSLNAMGAERLQGIMPPEMIDKEKSKTPCMGGILIIGAIVVAGILWTIMIYTLAFYFLISSGMEIYGTIKIQSL